MGFWNVVSLSGVTMFGCFFFVVVAVYGQVLAQWPQMFHILNLFGTGVISSHFRFCV